jgi:YidC/Oxa1 family membrane protein insertase
VIYWCANNILTFSQQYIIMRSQGIEVDLLGNIKAGFKRPPPNKSAAKKDPHAKPDPGPDAGPEAPAEGGGTADAAEPGETKAETPPAPKQTPRSRRKRGRKS